MADAVERLVNLALYLADARTPVSAETVRAEVIGYPEGQDEAAFLRMFERDKDDLRAAGLAIEVDDDSRYYLDRDATYAGEIELSAEEAAAIRAAATAMLGDPAFPMADELRLALAKVAVDLDAGLPAAARLADEDPGAQGGAVARLLSAAEARKQVMFTYTTSLGETSERTVDPYGLFARDGRWYLVGRDDARDEIRTFAVARIEELAVNAVRPRSADFERPDSFDVASFITLPFQYGPAHAEFPVTLHFDADQSWRAAGFARDDEIEAADGGLLWRTTARDADRLLRFVVENGPGITIVEPASLAERLAGRLEAVALTHEGASQVG